ncbi:MAG: hypothetical protein QG639_781 [Patescibacteria group bacterium]|nr:hypothetical protein [Patescibacteria group bacterium]
MNDCILSICIVSYNTSSLTLDALRSSVQDILRSPFLKNRTEILVVDNNSSDDSVAVLKEYKKATSVELSIIENPSNTGFAHANNLAISKARGKYILLLNSDTFVQPLALEKLVAAFEEIPDQSTAYLGSHKNDLDRLGILSACLVNSDGTYQHQGGNYPTLVSVANHLLLLDDIPVIGSLLPSTQRHTNYQYPEAAFPKLIKKDWVAGTAMVLRKEMLDEIGTLDEKIFMYGEDVELCVRAKDHHWDVAMHPTALITHLQSASSSSSRAIVGEYKGYQYIWAKHKPIWQMPILHLIIRVGILLRILLFGTMGSAEKVKTYKQAWKEI